MKPSGHAEQVKARATEAEHYALQEGSLEKKLAAAREEGDKATAQVIDYVAMRRCFEQLSLVEVRDGHGAYDATHVVKDT